MLQAEAGDGPVARAGEDGEGDHGPVALFNVHSAGQGPQRLAGIIQRRHGPFAPRASNAAILVGGGEVSRVVAFTACL